MSIIIIEKDRLITSHINSVGKMSVESYSSVEEFLASGDTNVHIMIVRSENTDAQILQEICASSIFTLFITDRPNDVVATNAYSLPSSTDMNLILATLKAILENITARSKGVINPLPRPQFDNSLYSSLKQDMLKDAESRVKALAAWKSDNPANTSATDTTPTPQIKPAYANEHTADL